MKKDFLILTFALVILALSHTVSSAQVLHDWLEPNPDGNDGYTWASTSKYAEVTYTSVIGFSPASYWALTASASADASADPLGPDSSYDATAWCQTTADRDSDPIPSRGNIHTNRIQHDSEGLPYYGDEHRSSGSGAVAYKKHPVSSIRNQWWNPLSSQTTRSLSLALYSYLYERDYTSPSGLTANPYAYCSIESDSNMYVNMGFGKHDSYTP